MSDGTKIEWTEATWNPITGCSILSAGCTNCYAMKLAGTRLAHHPSRAGLTIATKAGPVWTGEVRFNKQWLDQPLRWKRPRMIFVCAHGDLFHESVADEWIDRVFAVMALCPQHTFQVLTKRSARMREYLNGPWQARLIPYLRQWQKRPPGYGVLLETVNGALPNVWLGVSVEDQQRADERIPDLLATPAVVRWLSCEPLLGWLDLRIINQIGEERLRADMLDVLKGEGWIFDEDGELDHIVPIPKLDWIVAGGESGPGARPMHPDWARSLRDQCAAAGVPLFFKQWGDYRPCTDAELKQACGATLVGDRLSGAYMMRVGKKAAGRLLDGAEHNAFPTGSETLLQKERTA